MSRKLIQFTRPRVCLCFTEAQTQFALIPPRSVIAPIRPLEMRLTARHKVAALDVRKLRSCVPMSLTFDRGCELVSCDELSRLNF